MVGVILLVAERSVNDDSIGVYGLSAVDIMLNDYWGNSGGTEKSVTFDFNTKSTAPAPARRLS